MNDLEILFSEIIETENFKVKQPTFKDVLKITESKYEELMLPYTISTELLNLNEDEALVFKSFDLFFIKTPEGNYMFEKDKKPFLNILMESLEFIFGGNVQIVDDAMCLLVEQTVLVHRDNFDELAEAILKVNNMKRAKVQKAPEWLDELSPAQRDIYEKLMNGRKREAEKNSLGYMAMANTIMHGGKSFIPYKEVKNMTLLQFFNTFQCIMGVENFEKNYSKYLVGEEPKNLDLEHWLNKFDTSKDKANKIEG